MGQVRHVGTQRTQLLEPEFVVGRAPTCGLRLRERYVSAQHALVRWGMCGWELKDLGSRNGTFLNGSRLEAGREYQLVHASKIAFGRSAQEWELFDTLPPSVMAVPANGGPPVLLDGELLVLPSNEDPRVSIYRDVDGWVLEQPDSIQPVANQQTFGVDGVTWKFCCVEQMPKTSFEDMRRELEVRQLSLLFTVSRDEEHVELQAQCGSTTIKLGARSHNYLLLTLARQRVSDTSQGLAEESCGWVYLEDLGHDPSMAPPNLNIDVFRVRKHFASVGVVDAANIVERRPRTKQIRIGTGALRINLR